MKLFILALGTFIWGLASDAHAYIDPGTGSYLLQLIIGGALAAGVFLKTFPGRISGFFKRLISGKPAKGDDDSRSDD